MVVPLYVLYTLMNSIQVILIQLNKTHFLIAYAALSLLPSFFVSLKLHFTTYYFHDDHVISEIKFLSIKRHSLPYSKITNITSNISIWDRICNAGDLVLYTAEDKAPDLKLKHIADPEKIEKHIFSLIK